MAATIAATLASTAASWRIGRPHSRSLSPRPLVVASSPILPPSPDTGDAKSSESIGVRSTRTVSRTGSIRVVIAQITSGQLRTSTSSSVTTMNLVYMNWRRKLQTPNMTRFAWPGYCLRMLTIAIR